jgi:hypothetical protein
MSQKYKSRGTIRYNPKHSNTRHDKWWMILECGRGLVLTYKWLLKKDGTKKISSDLAFKTHNVFPLVKRGIDVSESTWKSHISIVRGERPTNVGAWNKYNGVSINFEYSPIVQTNGAHYWLPVISDDLDEIRRELGLADVSRSFSKNDSSNYIFHNGRRIVKPPQFHLTIGKDIESNLEGGLDKKYLS